jgi:hypothetical protein
MSQERAKLRSKRKVAGKCMLDDGEEVMHLAYLLVYGDWSILSYPGAAQSVDLAVCLCS